MVVPRGIYVPTLLLPSTPPGLILVMAFYSLEEGGANQHNVVPASHNLEFWPHSFGHIALPTMCKRSRLQRALLPKG